MEPTRNQKQAFDTYTIVLVGVMAGVVFIVNFFSIPLPVALGDVSRIHLGNAFCVLAGFLLGPVAGGLAAGIGSGIFDLTNPAYASTFYITLIFKFVLGYVAGKIAHAGGRRAKKFGFNLTAAICGSLAYVILYLSKHVVEFYFLLGNPWQSVVIGLLTKLQASLTNAAIAVVISMALSTPLVAALDRIRSHSNSRRNPKKQELTESSR